MDIFKQRFSDTYKIYFFVFFNKIGEFVSYLAIVAIPNAGARFFFDLSILFTARQLGAAIAYYLVPKLLWRFSEKQCIIISNLSSAAIVLAIVLFIHQIYIVAVCLFILGFADNLTTAAVNQFNSYNVKGDLNLLKVNHIIQILTYITMVLGGTLGGFLIERGGIVLAFLIDALSFVLSVSFVLFLSQKRFLKQETNNILQTGSLQYSNQTASFAIVFIFYGLVSYLVATFNFVEIPYYLQQLQLAYHQLGAFFSVTIFGLIAAHAILKKKGLNVLDLRQFLLLCGFFGICFFALSLTAGNLVLSALALLCFIGTLSIIRAALTQIVQTRAEGQLRSKLLSLLVSVSNITTIFTTLIIGLCADRFGLLNSMQIAAVGYFIILFPLAIIMMARGALYERPQVE